METIEILALSAALIGAVFSVAMLLRAV